MTTTYQSCAYLLGWDRNLENNAKIWAESPPQDSFVSHCRPPPPFAEARYRHTAVVCGDAVFASRCLEYHVCELQNGVSSFTLPICAPNKRRCVEQKGPPWNRCGRSSDVHLRGRGQDAVPLSRPARVREPHRSSEDSERRTTVPGHVERRSQERMGVKSLRSGCSW